MTLNTRFGWHSGVLRCKDIVVSNDLTITGNMSFGDASTDTLTVNGFLKLDAAGGADSANALLMGVGTTASPATTAVANKVMMEFRTQSTATSGDSRCLYMRHDIAGAAGGGEALRAFSKVSAAASTVRGAHISVDLATAGSVSGFGAAVDAQVMLGGAAYDDTLAAVNAEIYMNASATITGTTSMLRCVIQGDATAVADAEANAFMLDLSEVTAGSAGFIDTDITAVTGYGSLRVKCPDGVTRYIPITTGS